MAKKKNVIIKEAKDVVKVGTVGVVGHGVLGKIASTPGMPTGAVGTASLAGVGLRLATLGQVIKSGESIVKNIFSRKKKTKKYGDMKW